jgi:hypothetical protein
MGSIGDTLSRTSPFGQSINTHTEYLPPGVYIIKPVYRSILLSNRVSAPSLPTGLHDPFYFPSSPQHVIFTSSVTIPIPIRDGPHLPVAVARHSV